MMGKGAGIFATTLDRMRRVAVLAGWAAAVGVALTPQAARAQFFWDQPRFSPDDAARTVMERGFRPLRQPTRNDRVYVADVLDRRGRHERLIISAESGEILQRFYLEDGQPFRRDADSTIPPGPIPPGRIPNAEQPNMFSRLFGDQDAGTDHPRQLEPDHNLPVPVPPKPRVRRTPRVVERAPETVRPSSPIESAPLAPIGQQAAPAATSVPAAPPAQDTAVQPPSVPEPAAPPSSKPPTDRPVRVIRIDPLAIPGSREQDAKPATTTATVAAKPASPPTPAKPVAIAPPAPAPAPKDVPVAPLD